MSRSYWRAVVAVGLIVLCVLATYGVLLGASAFQSYQQKHKSERGGIVSYEAGTSEQYADSCAKEGISISFVKCLFAGMDANRNAQRSAYDLQAQQEMAEWAYAMLLLSFGTLIVSGVGLVGLFVSLNLTRTATNAAVAANKNTGDAIENERKHAIAQLRPYVYVSDAVLLFNTSHTDNVTTWKARALVAFKNFGQTPAKNVTFRIEKIFFGIADESKFGFGEAYYKTTDMVDDIAPTHVRILRTEVQIVDSETRKGIESRERVVYVFGSVRYENEFAEIWEMGFRRSCKRFPKESCNVDTYAIPEEEDEFVHMPICRGGNYSHKIEDKP